jgi:hypothetical protein
MSLNKLVAHYLDEIHEPLDQIPPTSSSTSSIDLSSETKSTK